VLSGGQRRRCLRVVKVIRRGDVDHVDPRVGQHGLEGLVGRRQAERGSAFRGPGMAGSNDPVHLHAEPAQRLDVHRADEAGPDDGSADFSELGAGLHSADSTGFDHNPLGASSAPSA
jgi:hypothetical protein